MTSTVVLFRYICRTSTSKVNTLQQRFKKGTENKLEGCPSRELDVAEAEVEVVAPDGQPLHVRDLDGRGQPDDQPSLKKIRVWGSIPR